MLPLAPPRFRFAETFEDRTVAEARERAKTYPCINCTTCGEPCEQAEQLTSRVAGGTFCGRACAMKAERAQNPMIRRPWRGTMTEWVQFIEDHKPVPVSAADIVAKLAKHFNVGAPTVEQLARALFESDDEVIAFVADRSEWQPPGEFVVNPNLKRILVGKTCEAKRMNGGVCGASVSYVTEVKS